MVLGYSARDIQNLAVDWINFKLYVLETIMERIDICDFDGSNRVTLVAENLVTPHGLALDPTVGCVSKENKIYFLKLILYEFCILFDTKYVIQYD